MFYNIAQKGRAHMKLLVTLTPAESCRLIAKAVVAMPCVQDAKEHANLIVYGGTTNAFVVQELLHTKEYIPSHCTVGINTSGRLALLPAPVIIVFRMFFQMADL